MGGLFPGEKGQRFRGRGARKTQAEGGGKLKRKRNAKSRQGERTIEPLEATRPPFLTRRRTWKEEGSRLERPSGKEKKSRKEAAGHQKIENNGRAKEIQKSRRI